MRVRANCDCLSDHAIKVDPLESIVPHIGHPQVEFTRLCGQVNIDQKEVHDVRHEAQC